LVQGVEEVSLLVAEVTWRALGELDEVVDINVDVADRRTRVPDGKPGGCRNSVGGGHDLRRCQGRSQGRSWEGWLCLGDDFQAMRGCGVVEA
jgi:hypothetical protein